MPYHGQLMPDGSRYVDNSPEFAAQYAASKGQGGVTGEVLSGAYIANPNAPAYTQPTDLSWLSGGGAANSANATGMFGNKASSQGIYGPAASPATPTPWGAPATQQAQAPLYSGTPGGFGSMNGGYGTTSSGAPGQRNPYLSGMADEIGRRTQQGLGQAFNQIRSNAVGNGGLGGSRQGVAQGIATQGAMDSLQGNLSNLYGQSYQFDTGQDTIRRGQDDSMYTAQRQLDQSGKQLGANLYQMGQQGDWYGLNQMNNIMGNYTGLGTQSQTQGGGWMGALGGAGAGLQMYRDLMGTNGGNNYTGYYGGAGLNGGGGFGTGSAWGNQDYGSYF